MKAFCKFGELNLISLQCPLIGVDPLPIVCMESCLPHTRIDKVIPIRYDNLVAPPRHLSDLSPHLPRPTPCPSILPPWHEMGCHFDHPAGCQRRRELVLPGVLRFPQTYIEVP